MADNVIKFKLLDEFDATETPTSDIKLYFPFKYEKSTLYRYRAQLIFASSDSLESISVGISKASDQVNGSSVIFYLRAYDASDTTNLGLNGANLASAVLNIDSRIPKYDQFNESIYVVNQVPFTDVSFLDTTNTGYAWTKGSFYWLIMDCGKLYNSTIGGYVTPDLYFLMSENYSPLGDYNVLTGFSLTPSTNYSPLKSDTGSWSLTDTARNHLMLINGESPVRFTYSLDGITYKYYNWDDAIPVFAKTGWQTSGTYDISIIDSEIGGLAEYGDKTVYIKFIRNNIGSPPGTQFSDVLSSNIKYVAARPIVTEVLLSYVTHWNT